MNIAFSQELRGLAPYKSEKMVQVGQNWNFYFLKIPVRREEWSICQINEIQTKPVNEYKRNKRSYVHWISGYYEKSHKTQSRRIWNSHSTRHQ